MGDAAPRRAGRFPALLLALSVAVAACGGGDNGELAPQGKDGAGGELAGDGATPAGDDDETSTWSGEEPGSPGPPALSEAGAVAAPGAAIDPAGQSGAGSDSSGVPGLCARPVGSSGKAPEVRVSEIEVGGAVVGYGREGDTEPLPLAMAAAPSGRSWLAWLGTDSQGAAGHQPRR